MDSTYFSFRSRCADTEFQRLQESCYTRFCNDDTDQIHDETARQSRSAFGIGLSIALI